MEVVRPGDTLSEIAVRFGTSVARLVALNRISNADMIVAGQVLIVAATAARGSAGGSLSSKVVIHVVQHGENLTRLAARYGTSVTRITAANHLSNANRIVVGQHLRIPTTAAIAAAPRRAGGRPTSLHVVRAGETLSGIARAHATSVATLVSMNHLSRASYIRVGQRLLVPGAGAGSQAQGSWSTHRFPAATRTLMSRRATIRDLTISEARRAGVPVPLALAVAWQESGWRQGVVSGAGAIGVMQLLPGTGACVADAMLHARVNVHDARSNVRAGVALLKHYLLRYRRDLRRVLAAYYQGQRAVDRYGIFPVSRPYIASIMLLEEMLEP